ncbi:MAG: carboxypeptidase-like regulatory domain-containing protein [Bacteroidota bacterium]
MKKHINKIKIGLVSLALIVTSVMTGLAQETIVSGTVTDAISGSELTGVNVIIKGTTNGTITDLEGKYSLRVESGQKLVFSFIGYQTQELVIGAATTIDVQMQEDVTNLEEVVVTGLASSVKRTNLANAISTVSADELTGTTKAQTVDNALYGKLTGVNIKANGGAPGGGVSVQLRGISTVSNGNSQPLYIVDAVLLIYTPSTMYNG